MATTTMLCFSLKHSVRTVGGNYHALPVLEATPPCVNSWRLAFYIGIVGLIDPAIEGAVNQRVLSGYVARSRNLATA